MQLSTGNNEESRSGEAAAGRYPGWLIAATWVLAFMMLALMAFALYQYFTGGSLFALIRSVASHPAATQSASGMPAYDPDQPYESVVRKSDPDTVLPEGLRQSAAEYVVDSGDSLFGIAENFDLEPESVLWANPDQLNDSPHFLSVGMHLRIPPTDGILYKWQEGDKLDHIAGLYKVDVDDIVMFPGNDLDITDPQPEPGQYIMIPGGWRPLQPWVIPVQAAADGGTTAVISGPGSCTPGGGVFGTPPSAWPGPYPGQVSGNDYYPGHEAIDAMCYEGDAIFASGAGVVIYAGWIEGGYGNMVAIDHGSGYLTIYAHLSSISVGCGNYVNAGQVIGGCGSSGNSTGAHLHFEVRQGAGFLNPWQVLVY